MEKKSLSQQTAERLYTMIAVERRLAPGEKLPGEVELAKELGVSRTTLREAIHVLVSQNLLEARRGGRPGLDIAAPLCLEDGTGRPTAELDNAYFRTKETNA